MFWHLKRKGVLVIFWVVNSEEEVHRVMKYPCHGFITDHPEEIRRVIDSTSGRENSDTPIYDGNHYNR